MDIELTTHLQGYKRNIWEQLLTETGLSTDETVSQTVLVWDGDRLIATGSRHENILKCIAIAPDHQGMDLTATVLTRLRQSAFQDGLRHLFLYTKPAHRYLFSSLFFYPVAQTDQVLLMENERRGIQTFLNSLSPPVVPGVPEVFAGPDDSSTPEISAASDGSGIQTGIRGALVMNCNPFTLGHQYLIKTAAGQCDHLYVFVLSEDKSDFSAADRIRMVRLGTEELTNVTILPTGPYLISNATFPTYFLKNRDQAAQIHCQLDMEIFSGHFAPHFQINRRYVGTEPGSPLTARYNEALKQYLPGKGIQVVEVPRLEVNNRPISASHVREQIKNGDTDSLKELIPITTYQYLQAKGLLS